jgi:CubicO group peptidase (beta-lactamase class C family)
MTRSSRHLFRFVLSLAAVLIAAPAASTGAAGRSSRLETEIAAVRSEARIPGIVAVAFADRRVELAVQGERRIGSNDRVRLGDRFHIGSNLKSMTATLIAALVERRRLRWDSTLAELLPDVAMQPAYREVTIEQLLQHRGGIVALLTLNEIVAAPEFSGTPSAQRAAFAAWALAQPPAAAVGSFAYSNGGYGLAGAIVDRVAGMSYERAMQRFVFRPLRIEANFGWPAAENPRQPWGHYENGGTVVATAPDDPVFQIPDWLTPAGDASMSILDYASYVLLHVEAACGRPRLLGAASFERLHRIPESTDGESYSAGWVEFDDGSGGRISAHSGSADNFYASVAYDHACSRGIAVIGNSGSTAAGDAIEELVARWIAE